MSFKEETEIQRMLVRWLKFQYPRVLFNSGSLAGNATDARRGKLAKDLGYHKGWPDIEIMEQRNRHAGLFLEIKSMSGTLSDSQKEVSVLLEERGYAFMVAKGFDEARDIITKYLEGRL